MTLDLVIKAIINSEHGWAVADQFEATFNGESFEEQNGNALRYIHDTLRRIINSDVFNDESLDALDSYYGDLKEYMGVAK